MVDEDRSQDWYFHLFQHMVHTFVLIHRIVLSNAVAQYSFSKILLEAAPYFPLYQPPENLTRSPILFSFKPLVSRGGLEPLTG